MVHQPDGNAVVYCEGAFGTTNGKTAHGLVRRTSRYNVVAVIDSRHADKDAGEVLDGKPSGIPVVANLEAAVQQGAGTGRRLTHFVVGLAPDGGRLPATGRADVIAAVELGLHVDSGLHDFLTEDPEVSALAAKYEVTIRDVRKPPDRNSLHFFAGKIEKVDCLKVAVLGTDSAVGKRTTSWLLVDAFNKAGHRAELIGTGQTAWMQGARYGIIMDSLINDFVSGEIEHAVYSAWEESKPDVVVLEGQGSLMNPAYPGGFELLAAGRPDVVVLQHAPRRLEYDGFPGYTLHPLPVQIQAVELLSGKPVVAVTLNHENLPENELKEACDQITSQTGLPAWDVLVQGADELAQLIWQHKARGGT